MATYKPCTVMYLRQSQQRRLTHNLIRAAGSSPRDLKTVAFSTPLAFTWRLLR
jgi:hypothetical protein